MFLGPASAGLFYVICKAPATYHCASVSVGVSQQEFQPPGQLCRTISARNYHSSHLLSSPRTHLSASLSATASSDFASVLSFTLSAFIRASLRCFSARWRSFSAPPLRPAKNIPAKAAMTANTTPMISFIFRFLDSLAHINDDRARREFIEFFEYRINLLFHAVTHLTHLSFVCPFQAFYPGGITVSLFVNLSHVPPLSFII